MNGRDVSEALGQIDGKYVTEALTYKAKRKRAWLPWAAIAACLCLLLGFLFRPDPLTYSGPAENYYGEGVTLSAPVIAEGGEDLITERVRITLDLEDLHSGQTLEDYLAYRSTAAMEYTFHNPTDETITAKLTLPCGQEPFYAYDYDYETDTYLFGTDAEKYAVAAGGKQISAALRITGTDALPEPDGAWKNGIFTNDTPVVKLTYRVTDLEETEDPYAAFRWSSLGKDTRMLCEEYQNGRTSSRTASIFTFVEEGGTYVYYIFGERTDWRPTWKFYGDRELTEPIGGTMELVKEETMTFLDYAMQTYDEGLGVTPSDWACALAGEILQRERGFYTDDGFINFGIASGRISSYRWYEYELTLGPGETVVNTVTMPMYPGLFVGGGQMHCDYTLDLLSLRSLAPTGAQELILNTPFSMTESSAQFTETETGFTLDLQEVTGLTLTFTLEDPEYNRSPEAAPVSGWYLAALGILLLIPIGLVIRYARKKRYTTE